MDEQECIPSVFLLSDRTVAEYLNIVKCTMKNHPIDASAIENAFYEKDFNGVFEAFDLTRIGEAEKEIPNACRRCNEIWEECTLDGIIRNSKFQFAKLMYATFPKSTKNNLI